MNKQEINQACKIQIEQKIEKLGKELSNLQHALLNETKSSVGDKYETERSMIHAEMAKVEQQKYQWEKNLQFFRRIPLHTSPERIELGSLVRTDRSWFYLTVGLGEIQCEQDTIFVISMASPMGQSLRGKGISDSVDFKGRSQRILEIK